jgi:hypothetical protein
MWLKPNADVGDILSIWQYALTVDGCHGHGTKSRGSGIGVESRNRHRDTLCVRALSLERPAIGLIEFRTQSDSIYGGDGVVAGESFKTVCESDVNIGFPKTNM